MSRASNRPLVLMPTEEEDRAITAAAVSDPDARPLTAKQLREMVPLRTLRGRPKSERSEAAAFGSLQPRGRGLFPASTGASVIVKPTIFASSWSAVDFCSRRRAFATTLVVSFSGLTFAT